MTPLKPDPCRITLRWYAYPPPHVGEWLKAKRTAYLLQRVKTAYSPARDDHVVCLIIALRFAIADIPADAVVHAFQWDSRKKKTRA